MPLLTRRSPQYLLRSFTCSEFFRCRRGAPVAWSCWGCSQLVLRPFWCL